MLIDKVKPGEDVPAVLSSSKLTISLISTVVIVTLASISAGFGFVFKSSISPWLVREYLEIPRHVIEVVNRDRAQLGIESYIDASLSRKLEVFSRRIDSGYSGSFMFTADDSDSNNKRNSILFYARKDQPVRVSFVANKISEVVDPLRLKLKIDGNLWREFESQWLNITKVALDVDSAELRSGDPESNHHTLTIIPDPLKPGQMLVIDCWVLVYAANYED